MRIFVGGSLRDVPDTDTCRKFIVALGRAIVERGHVLLNGCRNPVDKDIAEGAAQWLVDNKRDPKAYVISYWQGTFSARTRAGQFAPPHFQTGGCPTQSYEYPSRSRKRT